MFELMVFVPDVFDPVITVRLLSVSVSRPGNCPAADASAGESQGLQGEVARQRGIRAGSRDGKDAEVCTHTGLPPLHEPFAFMSVPVLFHVMGTAWAAGEPIRTTSHAARSGTRCIRRKEHVLDITNKLGFDCRPFICQRTYLR